MSTFGVNKNNDIYLGSDGNLVIIPTGIEATLEVCEHYAKAQRGEMIYQTNQGVPYQGTVFADLNQNQFRGNLGRQLLRVADVEEVLSIDTTQIGDVLDYVAAIKTSFGVGSINGTV